MIRKLRQKRNGSGDKLTDAYPNLGNEIADLALLIGFVLSFQVSEHLHSQKDSTTKDFTTANGYRESRILPVPAPSNEATSKV